MALARESVTSATVTGFPQRLTPLLDHVRGRHYVPPRTAGLGHIPGSHAVARAQFLAEHQPAAHRVVIVVTHQDVRVERVAALTIPVDHTSTSSSTVNRVTMK